MASGVSASATNLGVSPMRGAWVAQSMRRWFTEWKNGRAIARVQVEREPRRTNRTDVLETDLTLGTIATVRRFYAAKELAGRSMYGIDWPMGREDPLLQEAMDIAVTYLEKAGILRLFVDAEDLVAAEVLGAWSRGVRHKIALANAGIVAVQKQTGALPSVFPDVRPARQ
jgi:hypothetical protein